MFALRVCDLGDFLTGGPRNCCRICEGKAERSDREGVTASTKSALTTS